MNFNINEIKERLEKVKVIYTDIDGTFVHNGCLFCTKYGFTLKNASAIYDLLSAGVDIVMTSGREKEKLKDTARLLGFKNYIANLGIEIVYDQGQKVITNFGVDLPDRDRLKLWNKETGVVAHIFKRYHGKVKYYKPWSDILTTHHLLVGELDFPEVSTFIDQEYPEIRIIDNGAVSATETFKHPHAYHIVPRQVGKKSAVAIDKRERSLKKENLIGEVAVFFLLDPTVVTHRENVIYIKNDDSGGFHRIVTFLKKNNLI
ncbi:MAG: HAD hydrolase family protein [Calditrichia bacterium]